MLPRQRCKVPRVRRQLLSAEGSDVTETPSEPGVAALKSCCRSPASDITTFIARRCISKDWRHIWLPLPETDFSFTLVGAKAARELPCSSCYSNVDGAISGGRHRVSGAPGSPADSHSPTNAVGLPP